MMLGEEVLIVAGRWQGRSGRLVGRDNGMCIVDLYDSVEARADGDFACEVRIAPRNLGGRPPGQRYVRAG